MVGHHHPFVQFDPVVDFGGFDPFIGNDVTRNIQPHFTVDDIPEQARAILGAEGHKIRPGLRIIVALQTDGTATASPGSFMNQSSRDIIHKPLIFLAAFPAGMGR
jgi:hypothetical protein